MNAIINIDPTPEPEPVQPPHQLGFDPRESYVTLVIIQHPVEA